MSRAAAALAALLLVAAPRTGPAAEGKPAVLVPSALEIARRVQATYERTRDLTASFAQESTSAALGRTQRARGTVALKKPGKMRWDYAGKGDRKGQVLVTDGRTLWIYNPEDETVIRDEIGGALERTPLAFLMGLGELTRDFDVARAEGEAGLGRAGDAVIVLAPRQPMGSLEELHLAVDPKRSLVTAALIVDPFGNRTRVAFGDIRTNVGLPDSRFVLDIPPGVRVVEPPRLR